MPHRSNENVLPNLKGKVVAVDTETDGLDPHHGNRIFCWAYYTDQKEQGFTLKNKKSLGWLEKLLNDSSKNIVFQGAKYDLKMFSFEGIDIFNLKAKVHCTLTMSKVLNSVEMFHNLRYLSRKYLHLDSADKDAVDDWIKTNQRSFAKEYNRKPNFKDAPLDLIKRRAAWDAKTTLLLYQKLQPMVQKICPDLYETERRLIPVCIDMENTGVLIDITRAKKLRREAQQGVIRIQKDLNKLVCPLIVERKKKGRMIEEIFNIFNPNSSTRQIPAAFIKFGIELKYRTKPKKNRKKGGKSRGGNWCFDEYSLIRYVSKPLADIIHKSGMESWSINKFYAAIYQVVKEHRLHKQELLSPLIIKYRELSKLVTTYYDHLINDCIDTYTTPGGQERGVLHCKFNPSEAMTGRFSSSEPNLQNMPRLLGPRECFIPRKGRKWWLADYEQVEMRFYTHFAKDEKMAGRLSTDLHRWTASEMYKKPREKITKEERERAGSINFAVIYGSGAETMAETLSKKGSPTTESEALKFINKYHSIYPLVRPTGRRLSHQLKQKGYITNPFGRRYYIPIKFSYKALNYLCQGTSADQIKQSMVNIWYWLQKRAPKTKILIMAHDELIFEIPHSEEKRVVPELVKMMQDLTTYFVPITVGLDVALRKWSDKIDPQQLGLSWLPN